MPTLQPTLMPKNKKLALLYYGMPSPYCMHLCHQSHLSAIRDPNPSWDIDVFAHLFCPPAYKRETEHEDTDTPTETLHRASPWPYGIPSLTRLINAMWRPKGLVIEHPPSPKTLHTPQERTPPHTSPHTSMECRQPYHQDVLSACASHVLTKGARPAFWRDVLTAYGIDIASTLKSITEKKDAFSYDATLCMRMDVIFPHTSAFILPTNLSSDIFVPREPSLTMACAFGRSSSMDIYGRLFKHLPSLLTSSPSPTSRQDAHHDSRLSLESLTPLSYRHDHIPALYLYDEREKSLQRDVPQRVRALQQHIEHIKQRLRKTKHNASRHEDTPAPAPHDVKALREAIAPLKEDIIALYRLFDSTLPAQQWSTAWRKEHF